MEQTHKPEIDTINFRLLTFLHTLKNVKYIDFNSAECNRSCNPYKGGKPIYFDSWHLGKQLTENDKSSKLVNNAILLR